MSHFSFENCTSLPTCQHQKKVTKAILDHFNSHQNLRNEHFVSGPLVKKPNSAFFDHQERDSKKDAKFQEFFKAPTKKSQFLSLFSHLSSKKGSILGLFVLNKTNPLFKLPQMITFFQDPDEPPWKTSATLFSFSGQFQTIPKCANKKIPVFSLFSLPYCLQNAQIYAPFCLFV